MSRNVLVVLTIEVDDGWEELHTSGRRGERYVDLVRSDESHLGEGTRCLQSFENDDIIKHVHDTLREATELDDTIAWHVVGVGKPAGG